MRCILSKDDANGIVSLLDLNGRQLVDEIKQLDYDHLMDYFSMFGINYIGKTGFITIFFQVIDMLVRDGMKLTHTDIMDIILLTSDDQQTLKDIHNILNYYHTHDEQTLHV